MTCSVPQLKITKTRQVNIFINSRTFFFQFHYIENLYCFLESKNCHVTNFVNHEIFVLQLVIVILTLKMLKRAIFKSNHPSNTCIDELEI